MVLGGHGYPKWPPLAQKTLFLGPKKFWKFFSESSSQNKMFDTKTNFLSFVDPKLWPFKVWRYPKIAKFWKVHNTPPRGPRAKKFWFSKFLPRGYLYAKNDQNRGGKGVKSLWSALDRAIFVMFLGLPDDIHEEKPSFWQFKKNALRTDGRTDRRTDGRTDRRTDRPSYRDARTHLKSLL